MLLFPFFDLAGKAGQLNAGTAETAPAMWTSRKSKRFFLRLFADGFRLHIVDRRAADTELPGNLASGKFTLP